MPVSEAETISALRVLLNSSNEILQAHRDLALQTLKQVRSVLAVKSHNNNTTSSNIQAEPLPFCNYENPENHSSRQLGESSYSPASVFEDRSHGRLDGANNEGEPLDLEGEKSNKGHMLGRANECVDC
jgi:hypothetical protein